MNTAINYQIWKIDALPDTENPYLADEDNAELGWYWNDKTCIDECSINISTIENTPKLFDYLVKEHGFNKGTFYLEFYDRASFEICSNVDNRPEYAFIECND